MALSCEKGWGIHTTGLTAYRAGPGVGCGEAHGKWDYVCLFLSGRINLSV